MKVLVTGGAGYVGGVSVDAILAAGHEVVVLDDLTTGHRAIVNGAARLVVGLVRATRRWSGRCSRPSGSTPSSTARRARWSARAIRDPARYYRDNVAGGVALLEAARAAGVGAVVFSSTAAVYGVPDATPIAEDAPLRPINPYGETKRTFEGALRWYGRGVRAAERQPPLLQRRRRDRPASARSTDPETHLIPNVLIAAEGGPALTVFGDDYPTPDGTCIRDYIHVSDLADAHLARARMATGDVPASRRDAPAALVCNLGTSSGFSVREVMPRRRRSSAGRSRTPSGPRRAGDPPVLVASNARAGEVLGWTPRRSTLEAMVGSAWAWRRAHPDGLRRLTRPSRGRRAGPDPAPGAAAAPSAARVLAPSVHLARAGPVGRGPARSATAR